MLFDRNELRAAETGLVSPVVTDEAFAARRSQLHRAGKENPEEKVAALLVWLRHSNQVEGRSADVISDFWRCGTIAEMMGLSIEDMNRLLRGFEAQGLIETKFPSGLLLLRVNELEMIADGVGRESPALELPKAA